MTPRSLFSALVLTVLIAAPSLVAADPYQSNVNTYNNNGNSQSVTGTIQSVQGSSLTLVGGRVIFLHQGTIIRPTGLRLQAGMDVSITGVRSGHQRFNADEVDVTRRHHRN